MSIEINGRLTIQSLLWIVHKETGLPEADVREVFYSTFETITRAVANGHDVALTNFGTWHTVAYKARVGTLPGYENEVLAGFKKIRFRPSPTMKDIIANGPVESVSLRKLPKGTLTP